MSRLKVEVRVHGLRKDLPAMMQDEYDAYMNYMIGFQNVDPVTLNNRITGHVVKYMIWLFQQRNYQSISHSDAKDAIDYISRLNQEAKSSAKKRKQSIYSLMKWQFVQGHFSADELAKFSMIRPSTRHYVTKPKRALTEAEIPRIFENINRKWPYDPKFIDRFNRGIYVGSTGFRSLRDSMKNAQYTCLMMVALEMGLRRVELYQLTLNDLDVSQRSILVIGKGDKPRTVPYPDGLKKYVKMWISHRELIVRKDHKKMWITFQGIDNIGNPVSYRAFEKWINTIYDDKIDEGWHRLRRTFGRTRYFNGMDIGVLSTLMGHDDIKTTKIYLGIGDEDLVLASEAIQTEVSQYLDGMVNKGRNRGIKTLSDIKEEKRAEREANPYKGSFGPHNLPHVQRPSE